MVRKSLLVAVMLLVAVPVAAQEDHVWTSARPDGHAPLGVTGDRALNGGEFQITYRVSKINNKGVWFGKDSLPLTTTFEFYDVAPLTLENITHDWGLAFGVTDDLTLAASLSYSQREREQLTSDGVFYVTEADELGDLEVSALYRFLNNGPYQAHITVGGLIPVGEEIVTAETPFSSPSTEALPYDMRAAAGVYGVMPGITAQAQNEMATVGAQVTGMLYYGTNDAGFTPGDRIHATAWAAYQASDFFSVSARVRHQSWSGIEGEDPNLDPARDPGNDGFFMEGSQTDIPVGINFYIPEGSPFAGHRLAVEYIFPVRHDFEGPQLGLERGLVVGWQVSF